MDFVFRLEQRFLERWKRAGVEPREAVTMFNALLTAHTHPNRGYHDINHLVDLVRELDAWMHLAEDPDALFDGIMWHDKRMRFALGVTDNELQSAEDYEFDTARCRLAPTHVLKVKNIIVRGTTHKGRAITPDEKLMADMDLSNFGYPWPIVLFASMRNRFEWRHFPAEQFVAGRRAVLKMFLDRGMRLYQLPEFQDEYGERALRNIAHEIEVLPELVEKFDAAF